MPFCSCNYKNYLVLVLLYPTGFAASMISNLYLVGHMAGLGTLHDVSVSLTAAHLAWQVRMCFAEKRLSG
jgi:hypothetical protein